MKFNMYNILINLIMKQTKIFWMTKCFYFFLGNSSIAPVVVVGGSTVLVAAVVDGLVAGLVCSVVDGLVAGFVCSVLEVVVDPAISTPILAYHSKYVHII